MCESVGASRLEEFGCGRQSRFALAKEVFHMSEVTTASSAVGRAWDYKVVGLHARHNDRLEEALKELGADGWELCFVSEEVANEFRLLLKKPLA